MNRSFSCVLHNEGEYEKEYDEVFFIDDDNNI